MNAEDIVVNLLKLNSSVVERQTRFQRELFLLEKSCGAQFGFLFFYHDGSPYSPEVVSGWTQAELKKRIEIEDDYDSYGPRAIFRLQEKSSKPAAAALGKIQSEIASRLLDTMKDTSDIALELAADIVYLEKVEGYSRLDREQAIKELQVRKPLKARSKALCKEAEKLLENLETIQAEQAEEVLQAP